MRKKVKIILLLGLILAAILATGAAGYGFWFLKHAQVPEALAGAVVKSLAEDKSSADAFTHSLLGFDKPKIYLVVFLNNTEIRPGGGFIGVYAVVAIDRGRFNLIKLEGTELLDNSAPRERLPLPPAILQKYLKVSRWYFRDSNWSPDFASSSVWGLHLYSLENGAQVGKIDGVIGLTPTVMEEFLRMTGPIKAGGIEFSAENFTEQLEYEVEHGYVAQGKTTSERKDIIRELTKAIISQVKFDILLNYSRYARLAKKMLAEKQIALYSLNPLTQAKIRAEGWSGEIKETGGDYLLWADANLGALKTDHAIMRSLSYQVMPTSSGYVAQATMVFKHTKERDWRTSIYRDYARIFVPRGSKIVGVASDQMFNDKKTTTTYDVGEDSGKAWFGAYFTVGYKSKREITFTYILPTSTMAGAIESGAYSLLVQKQVGMPAVPLTVAVNLGKAIVESSPRPPLPKARIFEYKVSTDLAADREFNLKLE